MNARVIKVVAERDGVTFEDAEASVRECRDEILECLDEGGGYDEAADILESFLGLEPDYLEDMLFVA